MASMSNVVSRRSFLAMGAGLGTTVIAACTAPPGGTSSTTRIPAASAPTEVGHTATSAASTASVAATPTLAPVAQSAAPAASGGSVKIMRGGGNEAFWKQVTDGFKAKTGLTAEMVIATGNVEDGTIPTALKSGAGPDVVLVNSGPARVGFLAQAGLTRSLDDVYRQHGWQERLVPFAVDRLHNQGKIFKGKIWEVPFSVDVIYWYYNRDVFAKAGIQPPKTYDDMLANFEQLKSGGVYPVTVGVRSSFAGGWIFGNLVQATAGRDAVAQVLFGDGKWTQPEFVHAAQILQDWVKKQYIPSAASTLTDQQAFPLFLNKKAATYCVGTWFIPTMHDQKADVENVDTYETPPITTSGTRLPTGGFGSSWVVAANARNPDDAYRWLDYYLSDEVVLLQFNDPNGGTIPPVKAPANAKPNRLLGKAIDILGKDGTGFNPSVHVVASIVSVYYQSLQGLLGGLTTPEKAMADIQAAKERAEQA